MKNIPLLAMLLLTFTLCIAQKAIPESEEIFTIVDEMPRFCDAECEEKPTEVERKRCAEQKMLAYLFKKLVIPKADRENGMGTKTYVRFVVTKTGEITDVRITKDKGALGDAVLKVLNEMPVWTPGKMDGELVNVAFSLPIRIHLRE